MCSYHMCTPSVDLITIPVLYSSPVSNKPLGVNLIGITLGGTKGIFLNKHIVKLFSELHFGCIKSYYLNEDSVGYCAGLHTCKCSDCIQASETS